MVNDKEHIDKHNLPRHIAVIMDGNGRWAKQKGAERIFGHQNAVEAVRDITEGCAEIGVEYLTLYAFSTENWGRPKEEVDALMHLLVSTIKDEVDSLNKNQIELHAVGNIKSLPLDCQAELQEAIDKTAGNSRLNLTLALSYSGRWDIVEAAKNIAIDLRDGKIKETEITEDLFSDYLSTKNIPNPELMVRTSGEMRISNFLLWELAYSEIFITDVLWPDFRKEHLYEAIRSYQNRERRFGKISEQVKL